MKKNICIVVANYYPKISKALIIGSSKILKSKGIKNYKIIKVPGIFEIPYVIKKKINRFDAFIALGCVIKGETPHFDFISQATTNAIMDLSINNNLAPQQFILDQNYPNPYNPETIIRYSVSQIADVTLEIFDIRGNLIVELVSKMHRPGQYSILWNASGIAAGLYFIEMKAYSNNTQLIFKDINKMLYLK